MKKDSPARDSGRDCLERIARILDHPVGAFFATREDGSREAETLALIRAFDRIEDPQARARCLAFVVAEAERTDGSGCA